MPATAAWYSGPTATNGASSSARPGSKGPMGPWAPGNVSMTAGCDAGASRWPARSARANGAISVVPCRRAWAWTM